MAEKNSSGWTKPLTGDWEGMTKVWFEPGKLEDESAWKGSIRPILGGKFLVHEYQAGFKGKLQEGFALLSIHPAGRASITWVDTFHMSAEPMFSEGKAIKNGLDVLGSYDAGEGPRWGWRTTVQAKGKDRLVITMYNVTPTGQESKAVETDYRRAKPMKRGKAPIKKPAVRKTTGEKKSARGAKPRGKRSAR